MKRANTALSKLGVLIFLGISAAGLTMPAAAYAVREFQQREVQKVKIEVIPVTLRVGMKTSPSVGTSAAEKVWSLSPQGERLAREMEEELFRAVNWARQERGIHSLQQNPQLQRVARRHSEDMATRRFFDHTNPDGWNVLDRLRVEGIEDFAGVGENIFTGNGIADPVQLVVEEWLKSPGHRKNLLNPRYIAGGVGIAWGGKEKIYITQIYFEPLNIQR
ncbi:MAG: CAP domain-containing protein [Candidatus Tectomicrobia bacterium]|nr:CAP domain-containing protein [Candidatus Tectomicrobia bacterium]